MNKAWQHKQITVAFLALAVVSLLLLAAGIASTEMSTEWRLFEPDALDAQNQSIDSLNDLLNRLPGIPNVLVQAFFLTGLILVPLLLILAIFSAETRQYMGEELKRLVPFAIWILAIAYLFRRLRLNRNSSPADSTPLPPLPDWINNPPLLVTFGIGLLLVGGAVLLAWFFWRRLSRPDPLAQLAFEAQTAIVEIESGGDFKNAIIACYAGMCQTLRLEHGIVRAQGMTPREFTRRLEQFGLATTAAKQLTRLFENVRYGTAVPTEGEKREAIACLAAIIAAARPEAAAENGRRVTAV